MFEVFREHLAILSVASDVLVLPITPRDHYSLGMTCPMQPSVYIIILNWNGHQDTLNCLASLEQQRFTNYRILIVDNGSTDNSVDVLRGLGDRVILIENPTNVGYTGGNNLAMREAFDRGADYVWLFNNDAVAELDTLVRMIDACEADAGIGLASPLIREEDDKIQFSGRMIDLTMPAETLARDVAQGRKWQAEYPERMALTGTAMLVRRAVYEKIGGFDDRLFAYWEDTDYSIRGVRAGFRNVVVFDAAIFHPSKPTIVAPGDVEPHFYYFMARNEILLWRKFCSRLRFMRSIVWTLRQRLVMIERMPDNTAGLEAVLAGLWDGWRGIGGRYDPDRRMPFPFRTLLGRHPRFWIRLIDVVP
jgi:GT2 family glycosyltransferase